MKKILLLASLVIVPQLYADIKITLDPTFLQFDGKYLFNVVIKEKKKEEKNKEINVEVTVLSGQAKVKDKGGSAAHRSVKIDSNNEITIKSIWKKADELEILSVVSDIFPVGTLASMGLEKESSKFVVWIGEGLGMAIVSADKAKVGQKCTYGFAGADMPDGQYTMKIIIPSAKNKTYKFQVTDGLITGVLEGSGSEMTLAEPGYLEIDAEQMCRIRRTKKAVTGTGVAVGALAGSLALAYGGPKLLQIAGSKLAPGAVEAIKAGGKAATTQVATQAAKKGIGETVKGAAIAVGGKAAGVSRTIVSAGKELKVAGQAVASAVKSPTALKEAAKTVAQKAPATLASAKTVAQAAPGAIGTKMYQVGTYLQPTGKLGHALAIGSALGSTGYTTAQFAKRPNKEATVQITLDSGSEDWPGDRAVKLDIQQCNNNIFFLYRAEYKVNINPVD